MQPADAPNGSTPASRRRSWPRRIARALIWLIAIPLLLLALVAVLLYLPPVQNALRKAATGYLENKTGTPVRIEHIALRFPIGLSLSGIYLADAHGDTLLYAGSLRTRASLTALLRKRIILDPIDLEDVRAVIRQDADSVFNFDRLLAAFTSDTTARQAPADTVGGWAFALGDIHLKNIRAQVQLAPSHMDLAVRLGKLDVDMDHFSVNPLQVQVDGFALADTRVDLRMASGPKVPDPYPDLVSPFAGLDVRCNSVELENVRFTMKDIITGDSLWTELPEATLDLKDMDLPHQMIALDHVAMDRPVFGMITMQQPIDTLVAHDPPWLDRHDGFRYFIRDWNVQAKEVAVNGGAVDLCIGGTPPPMRPFDPDHLELRDVELHTRDLSVANDRISVEVERSSVVLPFGTPEREQQLAFNGVVELKPDRMALQQGHVELAGNAVDLDAAAFPGELAALYRAPRQVRLRVDLRTALDPTRIQDVLNSWGYTGRLPVLDERFQLAVHLAGTTERMDTTRIDMDGDRGSRLHGRASFADAAAWPRSSFDVDLQELRMGDGLRKLILAYMPSGTPLPRQLTASLKAHGTGDAMHGALVIVSDLGRISGTVAASGLHARIPDALTADLDLRDVALARLAGDTAFSTLSATIRVKGTALNGDARNATLSVVPSALTYHGQDLSSLRLTADAQGDSIHGNVDLDADAVRLAMHAAGTWPEHGDSLAAAFNLQVGHASFQKLGVTSYPLDLEGTWRGRAAADTSWYGSVTANGEGVRISNAQRAFRFERFAVASTRTADSLSMDLRSDAINASFGTNVRPDSILPLADNSIFRFFRADSSAIPAPGRTMDLAITLPKSDWLTGLVVPDLQVLTLKTCAAHYDGDAASFQADVDVPELAYDRVRMNALTMHVDAQVHTLAGRLDVQRISYDSLFVEGLSLTSTTKGGALESTLSVQRGKDAPSYQVGVRLTRTEGSSVVQVLPDGLALHGAPWTVDPQNRLRFGDHGWSADHFTLSGDGQRLALTTPQASDLRIDLEKFKLATVLGIVSTGDTTAFVGGTLSGTIDVPPADASGLRADLRVEQLALLGHPVGDLDVQAREPRSREYEVTAKLGNGADHLDGTAAIDASGAATAVRAQARVDFADVAFLAPFAGAYLYELGGGLRGDLHFTRDHGAGALEGALTFQEARLGVRATHSLFRLHEETLHFDPGGIHLNNFTLKDSLDNTFTLDGDILTKDLASFRFDLGLRTERFQLTHSVRGENDLFYGDVLAGLDLRITGTDRLPAVKGNVHVLQGTDLSVVLPGSKVELVKSSGIVIFTDDLHGIESDTTAANGQALRDSLRAQLSGVDLDVGIKVDPEASFAIVLDPTTGDQATFQGKGDLHFTYDPAGAMTLTGPFTLAGGGYTLEFYGLVKKRFDLVKGGTIIWSGDPLAARMDIKARYRSQSAPYPLMANTTTLSESDRNRYQAPLPFDVIIDLGGNLNKPDIDFGIDLDRSYRNSYPQVSTRLDQLAQSSNAEERNRQVFGLLVLNSFIQDEGSGGAPSSGIATSAARNSVNGILTDQMNKLTGRYLQGVNISLGVNTYDQAAGNSVYQRTSVDYKVSKSFLNERLSFEVGGSVGVDEQQNNVSNVSNTRAAQYVIYYDLTRDGRFRLRGFYENAFDLYDGEITDSGVAFLFTRDFEENQVARNRARKEERDRRAAEQQRKREEEDQRHNGAAPRKEDE